MAIYIVKVMGLVISITPPFSSPIWSVQKTYGLWRRTADYCKLKAIVIPVAVAVPDVFSPLAQIRTSPTTCYAATYLVNAFLLTC